MGPVSRRSLSMVGPSVERKRRKKTVTKDVKWESQKEGEERRREAEGCQLVVGPKTIAHVSSI